MKYAAVFCFCSLLLLACDPYYRLNYCVKNKTKDTLYVKFRNYPDSMRVISPDSTCIVKTQRGIGYARDNYKTKEFQKWFAENSVIIRKGSDKSLKKVAEATWKYEGKRIEGSGILYVNK